MKGFKTLVIKKVVVDLCSKDRELKHHRHYPLSRYHIYSLLELFSFSFLEVVFFFFFLLLQTSFGFENL